MTEKTAGSNRLKNKLAAGINVLGAFLLTASSDNAEVLAQAGFDFLLIDHEHGCGSHGDAIAQMRAMQGTTTSSILRVPSLDPPYIKRVLDAGVQGILCPMIENAAAAVTLRDACWYPPFGRRGAGGGTRALRYGYDANAADRVKEDVLIAVQIETAASIAHIPEIAAVEGVDLLVIGPRDLSASIGKLGRFNDPEVLSLVAQAEAAIIASGKPLGSVVYPGRTAKDMFASGYDLLIVGSDVSYLTDGARRALAPS